MTQAEHCHLHSNEPISFQTGNYHIKVRNKKKTNKQTNKTSKPQTDVRPTTKHYTARGQLSLFIFDEDLACLNFITLAWGRII